MLTASADKRLFRSLNIIRVCRKGIEHNFNSLLSVFLTLIICGREDAVTPLGQSEFMHERIEGSSLRIIDNAGHVSNHEQPEEFNKYILDLLNSLNTTSNK